MAWSRLVVVGSDLEYIFNLLASPISSISNLTGLADEWDMG